MDEFGDTTRLRDNELSLTRDLYPLHNDFSRCFMCPRRDRRDIVGFHLEFIVNSARVRNTKIRVIQYYRGA